MFLPSGACGGALMPGDTPRFMFSPGWPEVYPLNQECTWVIRSPDSTVEFNLLYLDMEDYPNCYFDSLVIRDGQSPRLHTPGPLRLPDIQFLLSCPLIKLYYFYHFEFNHIYIIYYKYDYKQCHKGLHIHP